MIITSILILSNKMNLVQLKMREARFWRSALRNKGKKFDFEPKIGWRALAGGEPTKTFPNWRCAFEKIRTDFAQNLS